MEANPKSSFWGGVSYIGKAHKNASRTTIVIAGVAVEVTSDDKGIPWIRLTSGKKQAFIVFEATGPAGLQRVLAVYNHPKADYRLVNPLRELIQQEKMGDRALTSQDLGDWDPDYLYE